MDLLTKGTNLLIERLNLDLQTGTVRKALGEALLAVNFEDLHRTLSQNQQTQHQISAWLGAGDHQWLAIEQVESILGADKVKVFAGRLGIDQATAATVLADILAMLTPEQVES
ncbi:YidB family protein [Sedimenticola thiotaurini]|nr:YidB family protein [Sedimenticola thiotaurini]